MLEIAICDDISAHAEAAKQIVQNYFEAQGESVRISLYSPYAFLAALDSPVFGYDVAILDIELSIGEEDGIELAKKINDKPGLCQIIFLSNYPKYIMDVYEADHVYFVHKESINRALPMALKKSMEHILSASKRPSIYLKTAADTVRLFLEEFVYAERLGRKTLVHTAKEMLTVTDPIDDLEKNCADFSALIRCHNSFLVHLKYVRRFNRNLIILHDDTEIPISRRYLTSAKTALMHYIASQ